MSKLPSKVEAGQAIVYDCTKAKRDRVLLEIAQAYVDGKLIEPLSREEIAKKLRPLQMWHGESLHYLIGSKGMLQIADVLLNKVGKVTEEKEKTDVIKP